MLVEAADAEFPTEQSVEASKASSIKKAVDLSPRERIAALGTELTAFPTWCTRPVRWALGAPARLSVPRGLLMPQKKSGKHDCGLTVFQHACQLGCEGIVSKRLGSLGGSAAGRES